MMYSDRELRDMADDISLQVEKNPWVSSHEIFLQSITRILESSRNLHYANQTVNQVGLAIRMISKSRRFKEIALSKSQSSVLDGITEPKSTQRQVMRSEFQSIKKPRITAVMGDESRSFDERTMDLSPYMDSWSMDNVGDNPLQIEKELDIILEKRLITNTGSESIQDTAMRVNYLVSLQSYKNKEIYHGSEEVFSRNLKFDPLEVEQSATVSLGRNMLPPPAINYGDISGIILDPDVAGSIITSFVNSYVLIPQMQYSWNWAENIKLYDDPHRSNGYYSTVFDDEGSLTRSKLLIDGGNIINKLDDMRSSNWKRGGNGFRTAQYQPLPRSYKYPLTRFYTNLVLYGGIGYGEMFRERRGVNLEIKKAQVFIMGDHRNPTYIIHGKEAYLWKNGSFQGPVIGVTISGSISDLMQSGQFSKDQEAVVNTSPGSIYMGWVYLQAGLASIRWK